MAAATTVVRGAAAQPLASGHAAASQRTDIVASPVQQGMPHSGNTHYMPDAAPLVLEGREKATRMLNTSSPRDSMVEIFLCVRDSPELLRHWVQHHLAIFGAEHIHIVDNMSSDTAALALLSDAAKRGVHVTRVDGPIGNAKIHMSKLKRLHQGHSSFLVPIDVDEFVGVFRAGHYSFRPRDVQHEFERLAPTLKQGRRYKFGDALVASCHFHACLSEARSNFSFERLPVALPARPGGVHNLCEGGVDGNRVKAFFPSQTFLRTDLGNHFGYLDSDKDNDSGLLVGLKVGNCSTWQKHSLYFPDAHALILVHFHRSPLYRLEAQRYQRVLAAHGVDRENCSAEGAFAQARGSNEWAHRVEKLQRYCTLSRKYSGLGGAHKYCRDVHIDSNGMRRERPGGSICVRMRDSAVARPISPGGGGARAQGAG